MGRFTFEGQEYVFKFTHNTFDNFIKNLNVVFGSPKMGVHTASGKDLVQSPYKRCLRGAFKPLMKHFRYEMGTFCMIKKWEDNKEETPTFAQEDPLAFEFTRLSKKDTYMKKKGRSEALDKAIAVIFPEEVDIATQQNSPEVKRKRRAFKKVIMEACKTVPQKKEPLEIDNTPVKDASLSANEIIAKAIKKVRQNSKAAKAKEQS